MAFEEKKMRFEAEQRGFDRAALNKFSGAIVSASVASLVYLASRR